MTTRAVQPASRPDLRLSPGMIAQTVGRLSVDAAGAWVRLLAALDADPDDGDDGLLDDDHALAAICGLTVGAWKRARRELEWRGAISSDDRSIDENGRVVHPGWLRLTLFSTLTQAGRARRERRSRAGAEGAKARGLRVVGGDDAAAEASIASRNDAPNASIASDNHIINPGNAQPGPAQLASSAVDKTGIQVTETLPPAREADRSPGPSTTHMTGDWEVPGDWLDAGRVAREEAGLDPVGDLGFEARKFVEFYAARPKIRHADWAPVWRRWVEKTKTDGNAPLNDTRSDGIAMPKGGRADGDAGRGDGVPEPWTGLVDRLHWTHWLSKCRISRDEARVIAPNRTIRDWVAQHLEPALRTVLGDDYEIVIEK